MKRIIALLLTLVMAVAAMALIPANAQDAFYLASADGTLVYTADFNDATVEVYDSIANGEKTISADGKSVTISHPDTAGSGFYGLKLPQFEFPGYVYTVEFWAETSDPATTRIGTRLVLTDGATYGFFTKKDEFSATATGLKNGTAQALLDGDNFRYVDKTQNNRQFFKVVIDGTTGTMTFYAKTDDIASHPYKYMGKMEGLCTTATEEKPSYLTVCMWLWDVGTITIGDYNIYKGNTVTEEEIAAGEATTEEVTTAAVTTEAVTTAEVTTAEVTTEAVVTAEVTTEAAEVTTEAAEETTEAAKSGCGSAASAAVVALVATLGCAVAFKKH